MKVNTQRTMHCPCGHAKVLAHRLCSICYTLKQQHGEDFGGLREQFWNVMAIPAA